MAVGAKRKVQNRILEHRGLTRSRRKRLQPSPGPPPVETDPTGRKSLSMRLVEARYGQPLEVLLDGRLLRESAQMIGISKATVSRWRKKLGLGHWQNQ